MLSTIQAWLQGYMDAFWSGKVNLLVFDGIPDNCTLMPGETKILSRSRMVQGDVYERTQYRFPLRYLAYGPSSWLENLGTWCREMTYQGAGPLLQEQQASVWLEDQACKGNYDGTWEYSGCLVVEFTVCFRGDDV